MEENRVIEHTYQVSTVEHVQKILGEFYISLLCLSYLNWEIRRMKMTSSLVTENIKQVDICKASRSLVAQPCNPSY
jgi:hypothetical protein